MTSWNITTVFTGQISGQRLTKSLIDELDALNGSAANAPRGQWTLSLWRDGTAAHAQKTGLADAVTFARDHGLPHEVVAIETVTEDELDARLQTPNYPDIVDATAAAQILGVSRQRVHQLAADHPQFPEPLYELAAGKLWTRPAVEGFLRHWDRRPGRPAKQAS